MLVVSTDLEVTGSSPVRRTRESFGIPRLYSSLVVVLVKVVVNKLPQFTAFQQKYPLQKSMQPLKQR